MTTITLEGKEYQLDIDQAKKLGLLKEKDSRVKSWEEFKGKYYNNTGYVYIESIKHSQTTAIPLSISDQLTPHEAIAIAAFSKLLKLRRDWIGEWEPDWTSSDIKYVLYRVEHTIRICNTISTASPLAFPSSEMAIEFRETFRDLIEEAKILI